MASYERLAKDHGEIDALARALVACLDAATPGPQQASELLHRLAMELSDHLAVEECALYPQLILANRPDDIATANRFVDDLTDLKAAWTAFLLEWSDEVVACDWSAFVEEARPMIERVRLRVQAENDLLYPLALQRNAISLRDLPTAIAGLS